MNWDSYLTVVNSVVLMWLVLNRSKAGPRGEPGEKGDIGFGRQGEPGERGPAGPAAKTREKR